MLNKEPIKVTVDKFQELFAPEKPKKEYEKEYSDIVSKWIEHNTGYKFIRREAVLLDSNDNIRRIDYIVQEYSGLYRTKLIRIELEIDLKNFNSHMHDIYTTDYILFIRNTQGVKLIQMLQNLNPKIKIINLDEFRKSYGTHISQIKKPLITNKPINGNIKTMKARKTRFSSYGEPVYASIHGELLRSHLFEHFIEYYEHTGKLDHTYIYNYIHKNVVSVEYAGESNENNPSLFAKYFYDWFIDRLGFSEDVNGHIIRPHNWKMPDFYRKTYNTEREKLHNSKKELEYAMKIYNASKKWQDDDFQIQFF